MKSLKSSHTGNPLATVLILYLGKTTRPPRTPGNLNGTYNTPKQYSRSTNNGGISKKTELHGANPCVLKPPLFALFKIMWCKPFAFSSCPSCATTCHPRPTLLLLVQDLSTVNDSTMSFLPLSLVDSATFSTPPFSNNHPLSLNWKDSRRMRTMSLFKALFASFTTCLQPRFT